MSKRELVPNRQYTDEFRVEAVRLAESIGGNKAAKRLGNLRTGESQCCVFVIN
jgi:transposase